MPSDLMEEAISIKAISLPKSDSSIYLVVCCVSINITTTTTFLTAAGKFVSSR